MNRIPRYFKNGGREFAIEDYRTPRPLLNYSWNDKYLSAFNHVATGHGLYCDKTTITATYIDPAGRVSMIKKETASFTCATPKTASCGTAGWFFWAVTQGMMGLKPSYDGFDVDPCLPEQWDGCTFERTFRGNRYEIEINNPSHVQKCVRTLYADGVKIVGTFILYVEDGKKHKITVELG